MIRFSRANIYPKVCVKMFRLVTEALETGDAKLLQEAQEMQDLVTEADSVINKVVRVVILLLIVSALLNKGKKIGVPWHQSRHGHLCRSGPEQRIAQTTSNGYERSHRRASEGIGQGGSAGKFLALADARWPRIPPIS